MQNRVSIILNLFEESFALYIIPINYCLYILMRELRFYEIINEIFSIERLSIKVNGHMHIIHTEV